LLRISCSVQAVNHLKKAKNEDFVDICTKIKATKDSFWRPEYQAIIFGITSFVKISRVMSFLTLSIPLFNASLSTAIM
jgi:hypothetical protein